MCMKAIIARRDVGKMEKHLAMTCLLRTEPRRDDPPEAPVQVPHHPQCPLGPPWCVNATPRLADRATARAFARRRSPQNGRAGGLGGARGVAEAKKVSPTPNATQGRPKGPAF